jgi:hypothetical protein
MFSSGGDTVIIRMSLAAAPSLDGNNATVFLPGIHFGHDVLNFLLCSLSIHR